MKALIFNIRLNSLYSIRIPFTWQSSLTYPLLTPSAIIGLLGNAYQRYKNLSLAPSLEWLKELEEKIEYAGSRLLTPCVVKSYITSAITKWEIKIGGKSTNALGREFVYTKNLQVVTILKDDEIINELPECISSTPLTCGDSESPITLEEKPSIAEVKEREFRPQEKVETYFPFPFKNEKIQILHGGGRLYLVHTQCMKRKNGRGTSFPLFMFCFPLREENGIIWNEKVHVELKEKMTIYEIPPIGLIIPYKNIMKKWEQKD